MPATEFKRSPATKKLRRTYANNQCDDDYDHDEDDDNASDDSLQRAFGAARAATAAAEDEAATAAGEEEAATAAGAAATAAGEAAAAAGEEAPSPKGSHAKLKNSSMLASLVLENC